jgi:hypothetical protein
MINQDTGMVMDYTYLKKVVDKYIIKRFDHHSINLSVKELQYRSTTELMSIWIWFTLLEALPGLCKIRLYETPDSWCDYEGPSFEELKKDHNHPDLLFLQRFNEFKPNGKKASILGYVEDIFDEPLSECEDDKLFICDNSVTYQEPK